MSNKSDNPQEKRMQSAEKVADCERENQERKPRSENSQMKDKCVAERNRHLPR